MGNYEKNDDYERVLKKFSYSEKKEIIKALDKLRKKICDIEEYGTKFEQIYNDDSVKYDIFKGGFYTYKSQGKDNSQIRILYRFKRDKENFYLELHSAYIKRRNSKEYMKEFAGYVRNYLKKIEKANVLTEKTL